MADRSDREFYGQNGDDPLAKLEELVNARTERMADEKPNIAPVMFGPEAPEASEAAAFEPLALDELMLRDSLHEPPLDPRLSLPEDTVGTPQLDEFELLPSLGALRMGIDDTPAAEPNPPALPELKLDPVVSASETSPTSSSLRGTTDVEDKGAVSSAPEELQEFETEINSAVEHALAAANAAIAVTEAQKITKDLPEQTDPIVVPELPSFEPELRTKPSANGLLSSFEQELHDDVIHIDEPGAIDPLTGSAGKELGSDVANLIRDLSIKGDSVGSRRNGMMIAAMLSGVAVLGAWGAFSLGGSSEAPREIALIRADASEYKIRPSDPGGRTVPNQNNPVYERVAQTRASQPVPKPETKLVTKSEDVRDVRAPQMAAGTLGQTGTQSPIDVSPDSGSDARAPRLVRTIKIDRDGGVVAPPKLDEPKQEVAALIPDTQALSTPTLPLETPPLAEDQGAPTPIAEVILEGTPSPGTPLPRFRPGGTVVASATQPVLLSADTSPRSTGSVVAVAPAQAEPTPSEPSPFVVQIASVPSRADAQASYATLLNKYSAIISGRGVDYQVAEIEGKGTYHRVRIPAVSKSDADSMCSQMKAIGGSCFVTR